jgi:hypothetical protein
MANEFNIKQGFISNGDSIVNGTLNVISLSAATYLNLPPAGISGSGSTGQISFFDETTSLTGSTNLLWSGTNKILEVSGKTKTESLQVTSGATLNFVLTSDSNGNATWQPSTITTVSANTATIHFTGNTVFGTFTSPLSTNITDNLTSAKLGVTQKIYHNSGSAPTVPAGWVLLGSTTYQISTTNIIYAEWSEGSRVEYWIVR